MMRICHMLLVFVLVALPMPALAANSATLVSQQENTENGEEPVGAAPTAETGSNVSTLQIVERVVVTEIVPVEQVVIIEQIVPVTQTVFVTEIVPVEQIVTVEQVVPVTQTVFVTEIVPVEQIVTVEQVVPVTEVVKIEEIVPVTQTVIVTEVVTVVVTEDTAENQPVPQPSPQPTVTPAVTPTATPTAAPTIAPVAPITSTTPVSQTTAAPRSVTHWTQLKPPYGEPSPLPIAGLAMYYAPNVMDNVARYRERVNKIEECEECIGQVALLRAGDIGRHVWIQVGDGAVEGPFQVLDVAGRHHIPDLLRRNWVVDVDYETAMRWGMRGPIEVTIYAEPQDKLAARPSQPDEKKVQ